MDKPRITVWGETIAEIEYLINIVLKSHPNFIMENLFVAKGKKGIGREYIQGQYREYSFSNKTLLPNLVQAPGAISDLVQWCSPDIILSKRNKPILSLEITNHEPTFNNVAQRIPRMIRAASLGIPSIIFHKSEPNNKKISWIAEVLKRISKITGTYSLPIFFSNKDFNKKRKQLVQLLEAISIQNESDINILLHDVYKETIQLSSGFTQNDFEFGRNGVRRKWLSRITDNSVEVSIGVKQQCGNEVCQVTECTSDEKRKIMRRKIKNRDKKEHGCMWLTKGTGGLDPYPGLIKLAEILCCYDEYGVKTRILITKFLELSDNFWWFKKNPDCLYYRLIKEFSDEILYSGQNRVLFTQATMTIKTRKYLSSQGWTIIYDDLPGGSRSGIGDREKVFKVFAELYKAYPDILCIKDNDLLIIEVDKVLNTECCQKLFGYLKKTDILKKEMQKIIGREVNNIYIGFAKIKGEFKDNEKIQNIRRYFQDDNLKILTDSSIL